MIAVATCAAPKHQHRPAPWFKLRSDRGRQAEFGGDAIPVTWSLLHKNESRKIVGQDIYFNAPVVVSRVLKEKKRVYNGRRSWSVDESRPSVLRCAQGFWSDIMLGGEAYLRLSLVTVFPLGRLPRHFNTPVFFLCLSLYFYGKNQGVITFF